MTIAWLNRSSNVDRLCENFWWWGIPMWFWVACRLRSLRVVRSGQQREIPQEPTALRYLHSCTKAWSHHSVLKLIQKQELGPMWTLKDIKQMWSFKKSIWSIFKMWVFKAPFKRCFRGKTQSFCYLLAFCLHKNSVSASWNWKRLPECFWKMFHCSFTI